MWETSTCGGRSKRVAMEERAWFRSSAAAVWHVVAVRDDQYLNGLCGFALRWVRAQQARAATALEPACERCMSRLQGAARGSVRDSHRPEPGPSRHHTLDARSQS